MSCCTFNVLSLIVIWLKMWKQCQFYIFVKKKEENNSWALKNERNGPTDSVYSSEKKSIVQGRPALSFGLKSVPFGRKASSLGLDGLDTHFGVKASYNLCLDHLETAPFWRESSMLSIGWFGNWIICQGRKAPSLELDGFKAEPFVQSSHLLPAVLWSGENEEKKWKENKMEN